MNIPILPTFFGGQTVGQSQLQNLTNAVNVLLNPPRVGLIQNTTQTIATATWTAVAFDTEFWDTDNMHSTTSNTSRVTATTAGMYLVNGALSWTAPAAGQILRAAIRQNGASFLPTIMTTEGVNNQVNVSVTAQMNAGDYLELMAYQSTGANLALTTSGGYNSTLYVNFLGQT